MKIKVTEVRNVLDANGNIDPNASQLATQLFKHKGREQYFTSDTFISPPTKDDVLKFLAHVKKEAELPDDTEFGLHMLRSRKCPHCKQPLEYVQKITNLGKE